MRFEGYEDNYKDDYENDVPDEEEVIEKFLGENLRARELRLMREALEQRRAAVEREMQRSKEDREKSALKNKLLEMDRQIEAIHQEEAITTFVENTVRVTIHRPSQEDIDEE